MSRPLLQALTAPLSVLALAALLVACDSAVPGPDTPQTPPGSQPDAPVPVERGAYLSSALFSSFGAQFTGPMSASVRFLPQAGERADAQSDLHSTSLWLAGQQDGRDRYVGATNAFWSGYRPCVEVELPNRDYFRLQADVDYSLGEWPVELGAPVTAEGTPRVYGDVMIWEAYCAEPVEPPNSGSNTDWMLRDVRVNTAVFQHDRADLERVRFFRYEVTNLSDAPITDLRAGFYSDPDVTRAYGGNLLGGTDRYATTYMSPARVGDYDGAFGAVAALGIVEFPKGTSLAARRIEYRNAGPGATPDTRVPYTESGLNRDERAPVFAMRGLDDLGEPIVDPTTAATEPFMYGGDPVAGTGWLDGTLPGGEEGWDIRVLQPTTAFTLAPGETVVLTAVAVLAVGDDLADGLAAVDATFSAVAADPGLWRFPIASE